MLLNLSFHHFWKETPFTHPFRYKLPQLLYEASFSARYKALVVAEPQQEQGRGGRRPRAPEQQQQDGRRNGEGMYLPLYLGNEETLWMRLWVEIGRGRKHKARKAIPLVLAVIWKRKTSSPRYGLFYPEQFLSFTQIVHYRYASRSCSQLGMHDCERVLNFRSQTSFTSKVLSIFKMTTFQLTTVLQVLLPFAVIIGDVFREFKLLVNNQNPVQAYVIYMISPVGRINNSKLPRGYLHIEQFFKRINGSKETLNTSFSHTYFRMKTVPG